MSDRSVKSRSSDMKLPGDLVSGLRNVLCHRQMDLRDVRPYADSEIKLVTLRRSSKYIYVLDRAGAKTIGVLRPAQRYVLKQGLSRIRDLADAFKTHGIHFAMLEGYARSTLRGGKQGSHLPPVIESVLPEEQDAGGQQEFQMCDGTHRVVYHCWIVEEDLRAVAVFRPSQPYYAYPACASDWKLIADNLLDTTPEATLKHAARVVPADVLEALGREHNIPKNMAYRRWFRDFESAFGFMGGQAGKPA